MESSFRGRKNGIKPRKVLNVPKRFDENNTMTPRVFELLTKQKNDVSQTPNQQKKSSVNIEESQPDKVETLRNKLNIERKKIEKIRSVVSQINTCSQDNYALLKEHRTNDTPITSEIIRQNLTKFNEILEKEYNQNPSLSVAPESDYTEMEYKLKIENLNLKIADAEDKASLLMNSKEKEKKEIEHIRAKHKFLKKQYDELDEFLRAEIELESLQDVETINSLSSAYDSLSSELELSKKKLIQQRAHQMAEQMNRLLSQIKLEEQRSNEIHQKIAELSGTKAQLESQCQLVCMEKDRLTEKLKMLKSIQATLSK